MDEQHEWDYIAALQESGLITACSEYEGKYYFILRNGDSFSVAEDKMAEFAQGALYGASVALQLKQSQRNMIDFYNRNYGVYS